MCGEIDFLELISRVHMSAMEQRERVNFEKEVLRKGGRSLCAIARFVDGYAAGWAFKVPEASASSLDMLMSPVKRSGRALYCWTQGQAFNIEQGAVFYAVSGQLLVTVDSSEPAGNIASGSLEAEETNYIDYYQKTKKKGFGDVYISYLSYDPGRVDFSVLVLSSGGWEKRAVYSCSQVEFVNMLHTGNLITQNGNVDIIDNYSLCESLIINSPEGKGQALSLSRILKEYDVDVGPGVASAILTGAGVLRHVSRWSESNNCEEYYKVFSEAGSVYGYDKQFRGVPTGQPVYYVNHFGPLADLIQRFMTGQTSLSVWLDVGIEEVESNGRLIGLSRRAHTGSEVWNKKIISIFRTKFKIPMVNFLCMTSFKVSNNTAYYKFFEYDSNDELLTRYEISIPADLNFASVDDLVDIEFLKQHVSWVD